MRIRKPTEEAALYNIEKHDRKPNKPHRVQVWRAKEEKTFAQFIKEQLKEEEHEQQSKGSEGRA